MGINGDLKEIVMESGHLFWIKTVVLLIMFWIKTEV